eukprot:COSAG01_NODE_3893_length_5577_cov_3.387550_4_plen_1018_part_00
MAFFLYLGLPGESRPGYLPQQQREVPTRSQSVLGPGGTAGRKTPAGSPNVPQSPLRLAPREPHPAPSALRASAAAAPRADTASNRAFEKLSKFKDLLDMGLIEQADYEKQKQSVLTRLLQDGGVAKAQALGLTPGVAPSPGRSASVPPAASPGASPSLLPDINSHRSSPTASSSARKKSRRQRGFGKTTPDDVPRLSGISVDTAIRMIREKIQGRLEGGPAGLRRAFQYFDADGSGGISHPEFVTAMRTKLMLAFDDELLHKIMDRFGGTGTTAGQISYQSFCEMVMGSRPGDATTSEAAPQEIPRKVLQRMVKESARDLKVAFEHLDRAKTGRVGVRALRTVLGRYNINLIDRQLKELVQAVGVDEDGTVNFMHFLSHFRRTAIAEVERETIGTVSGISVESAMRIIADKITQRMEGGPAGLRRAFQFFDADGSGSISHDEFKQALKLKTMLIFDDQLLDQIMARYVPGGGEIDYTTFCEMVMGSKASDSTGFASLSPQLQPLSVVKGKIRDEAKSLRTWWTHRDKAETGVVSRAVLVAGLQQHNILLREKQLEDLLRQATGSDKGDVDYSAFLDFFKKDMFQKTQSNMLGTISGISTSAAIKMIREKVTQRIKGGPAGLRRAWQELAAGRSVITQAEFQHALRQKLMVALDDELFAKVMACFGAAEEGLISYRSFCELVMGSNNKDSTSFAASPARSMERAGMSASDVRQFEASVRRAVLDNWKDLKNLFVRQQPGAGRGLSHGALREALEKCNIDMSDSQFAKLVDAIDTDGDGVISRAEFLSFIKKTEATQFTSSAVSAVTAETVDEAVELIRAKIAQRMEGGPAELRRAFQFFDADGSGTIDQNELARALKIKTMLVFKPHTLKGVYERFAEGDTGITFNTFCELLGSSRDDTTSMSDSQQGNFVGITTAPALLKAMQRHVREHTTWKALWAAFSHLDGDDSGTILGSKLRQLLRQHNMVFTDKQFELIAMQCVELEDGQEAASDSQFSAGIGPEQSRLVYHDFMDLFPPYH